MHPCRSSLLVLLCGFILPLLYLANVAVGSEDGGAAPTPMSIPVPLPIRLESALAQSFITSVVSSRYGVFSATLDIRASPNFPERLHGELIPVGHQQRKHPEQRPLEHFNHPRNAPLPPSSAASLAVLLSQANTTSQSNPDASTDTAPQAGVHPSLFALDVRLDFSGATAGTIAVTTLPATDNHHNLDNENDNNNEEEEEEKEKEGNAPAAHATFSFRSESKAMALSTLSDIPSMAHVATGVVATDDGAKGGTFTLRLFSEHEFSLLLELREGEEGVVDHIWVYGYAVPNEALIQRNGEQQPWWHMWALLAVGVIIFAMQLMTANMDVNRHKLQMQQRLVDAEAKRKKVK